MMLYVQHVRYKLNNITHVWKIFLLAVFRLFCRLFEDWSPSLQSLKSDWRRARAMRMYRQTMTHVGTKPHIVRKKALTKYITKGEPKTTWILHTPASTNDVNGNGRNTIKPLIHTRGSTNNSLLFTRCSSYLKGFVIAECLSADRATKL